jgi:DNA-binding PadR family transcriptional regulator
MSGRKPRKTFAPAFPHAGWPWALWRLLPRARRGDVRAAILALLAEGPRNGYQIMQELEQRSRGVWRPSPGAVYPALQLLEDEGLIIAGAGSAGRTFHLTERGRAHVEAHADELGAPWEAVSSAAGGEAIAVMTLVRGVAGAAMQVTRAGTPSQLAEALRILTSTRRALYRLLSEDDGDDDEP